MSRYQPFVRATVWAVASLCIAAHAGEPRATAPNDCEKPVYLTLDTGHMGVADLVADVLRRHQVRVTFFAANEATQQGDGSLGHDWAPWWKARAQEGHRFASHTWDHVYWRGDAGTPAAPAFHVRPSQGAQKDRNQTLSAAQYCAEIRQSADWLRQTTGQAPLPLWRAPGGKTSPQLLKAAEACGFKHVGWSPAGFLGDELILKTWVYDYNGVRSTRLVQIIRKKDNKLLAQASTTWCLIQATTGKPVRIGEEIMNLFKPQV